MSHVALVLMPFAAPQRPSIALGMLKAGLTERTIESRVHYANLWYAESISLSRLLEVERNPVESLVGEWIFSPAAFPDFQADPDGYWATMPDRQDEGRLRRTVTELRRHSPEFVDLVARRIVAEGPAVVGCSSMFLQHCASLALLRRVRELAPDIRTVIGGANCEGTMGEATHALCPWVDFVVNGEAELVFPELCQRLLNTDRDLDLPGVLTPERRGQTASRLVVDRLDQSPTPDYSDYFAALQASALVNWLTPGLLVETSRGCWWGQKHHCTFCGLNGTGMGYRSKSAERILEEVPSLARRYGVRDLAVVDNIINMSHLNSVLPHLEGGPYNLFYETKANLNRDQVRRLVEAGVNWIQPGIESLHDEVLKLMDKGTNAFINVSLLKWAREFGMQVTWNVLLGFPGEQGEWYREMAEWLPSVFHLQPPSGTGMVRFDRFSPYHTRPQDFGIELYPTPTYAFVYPDRIRDLAYFFEDAPGSVRRLQTSAPDSPHRQLQRQIRAWRDLHARPLPPILCQDDDGTTLSLLDTRPCAENRRTGLTGLARELYLFCEQTRSLATLESRFGSEARGLVHEFAENRLVLHLGDKVLSLAVSGELPGPRGGYPGGELTHIPEPDCDPATGLARLAERLLSASLIS